MKHSAVFAPVLLLASVLGATAADDKVEPAVPVTQAPAAPPPAAPPPAAGGEGYNYQQRLYGPAGGTLIAPDKANQIVQSFRAVYEKLGKPRVLFYVNRELVDEHSGLKLTGRQERTETTVSEQRNSAVAETTPSTGSTTSPTPAPNSHSRQSTVSGENTYSASDKPAATLTDKLTVREIETLFGRPFRAAGAALADQKVASSLIADQPIDHFTTATNESARKDREALAKVADLVVEILVSSRTVTVPEVSGDRTVGVPDIQVTAIRLSDAAILGQASASDVIGKDRAAAQAVQQFGPRDITEATALALMEDITTAASK